MICEIFIDSNNIPIRLGDGEDLLIPLGATIMSDNKCFEWSLSEGDQLVYNLDDVRVCFRI